VQAGYRADQHNNAVSVLIYQTTAFALGTVTVPIAFFPPIYTRLSNPKVDVLGKKDLPHCTV